MSLEKRSLKLAGHATSVALEPEFWSVLAELAEAEGLSMAALLLRLDETRGDANLASACRLAALSYARRQAAGR